ncbi:hypothetical protein [Streptomyces sp. NPDC048442]|uniref:hypothetical protein n=1 Tax=Streptomyces sp. NPDC048442 TaxID=3154823 RepID=UPI003445E252
MNTSTTLSTPLPYRIGKPDFECRQPVIITEDGKDLVLGQAFRWHRDWLVLSGGQETNLRRPPTGTKGIAMAATHLLTQYRAGQITPVPLKELLSTGAPREILGELPLLHPRMPDTPTNRANARTAFAGLAEHFWRPVCTGFPGSDNGWCLRCMLCGWSGIRYWSHHRGRNGNPPSPHRHAGGCIGKDRVRALISAYRTQ